LEAVLGSHSGDYRGMARTFLAILAAALALIVAAVPSYASGYHRCGSGSGGGGAFALSVRGISCRYASMVVEAGQRPGRNGMNVGGFGCSHRTGRIWHWRCTRPGGQGLLYETYG